MDSVILECVKEKSKLRVRIISNGYYKNANCTFPRDIRVEGRKYRVPMDDVKLNQKFNKWFYNIKKKDIEIIDEGELDSKVDLSKIKIYTDEENNECVICMNNKKEIVFNDCGHLYLCSNCAPKIIICPICRSKIISKINISDFE